MEESRDSSPAERTWWSPHVCVGTCRRRRSHECHHFVRSRTPTARDAVHRDRRALACRRGVLRLGDQEVSEHLHRPAGRGALPRGRHYARERQAKGACACDRQQGRCNGAWRAPRRGSGPSYPGNHPDRNAGSSAAALRPGNGAGADQSVHTKLALQPGIKDYAIIGDCRSAALISTSGSIDWLCLPRFDSPTVFASLLDVSRGGRFLVTPVELSRSERRYIPDTNVLETTFTTSSGVARVTDVMTVDTEKAKARELWPEHEILRKVECLDGAVDMRIVFDPRFAYGQVAPRLERRVGVTSF